MLSPITMMRIHSMLLDAQLLTEQHTQPADAL
jgi:hypothetical protein